jgi:hypothetical protein
MGGMAAFLTLPVGSDLTLADVEAWVYRARTLGAGDDAPVRLGDPPVPKEVPAGVGASNGSLTLSVPVSVTRTILPDA